jgi:transposase
MARHTEQVKPWHLVAKEYLNTATRFPLPAWKYPEGRGVPRWETRRKFDADFREGAVRLVRETGKPIAQVARNLGINEGTLGNWVDAHRRRRDGGNGVLSEDERAELARLRRENAELAMSVAAGVHGFRVPGERRKAQQSGLTHPSRTQLWWRGLRAGVAGRALWCGILGRVWDAEPVRSWRCASPAGIYRQTVTRPRQAVPQLSGLFRRPRLCAPSGAPRKPSRVRPAVSRTGRLVIDGSFLVGAASNEPT